MDYNSRITEEQRRAFAELIRDAEKRFEKDFDGYLDSMTRDLTPKIEARSRVRSLLDTVRNLSGKLSDATGQLRKMGFHVEDGMIAIDYDDRTDVRKELEQVKRSAIEERQKVQSKFRKALFGILSAQTADEARKIAEEVIG